MYKQRPNLDQPNAINTQWREHRHAPGNGGRGSDRARATSAHFPNVSATFYATSSDFESTCFSSVTEPADDSGGTSRRRSSLEPTVENTRVISDSSSTGRKPFEPRKSASEPAHAVTHDGRTIYPTSRWEREGLRGEISESGLNRRDIPFLPGSLDPYAGDATSLSRRDVLDEQLLIRDEQYSPAFNRINASDDHAEEETLGHMLSKLPIAAYASIPVNAYYDLASPAALNGATQGYSNAPPYYTFKTQVSRSKGQPAMTAAKNGAVIYGRCGNADVSMPSKGTCLSSLFIDYLAQFSEVWTDGSGNTFCEWINNNLFIWEVPAYMPAGSTAVSNQIGACYPSLANSRSAGIPVFEQRANEYKQSAFYVTEQDLDPGVLTTAPGIISTSAFKGQCPTNQVATLRSLAMITPFMNTLVAQNAFALTNDCIRGVYTTWYAAYQAQAAPTVPTVAQFIAAYNSWIKDIISGIQGAVTSQMDTLIPLYNDRDTTAVDVKLSTNAVISAWANLNPAVPVGTAWVPPTNLTLRNSVPAITWAANLP
ncbi:hypothetical protein K438DRAFT_1749915 [Mycena galopus ATCC 62051]|nr:hypothetical protein K438DRAFT_1749915 [Mycena galopus ATCC 62051]